MTPTDDAVTDLLATYDPSIRDLARRASALVREVLPDAVEELDTSAKLIAYSYLPGTYKGLILAVAPQRRYVNLMFSKGVELSEIDAEGLLEGTGKLARHVKLSSPEDLQTPALRDLIEAAAARTPR